MASTLDYVNTAIGIIAAVAAIAAARYAKQAPTKEDLERVEMNTATTSGHVQQVHSHMARQAERDQLQDRANRVSLSVDGKNPGYESLIALLRLKNSDVVLTGVGLYNESQSLFGRFPCEQVDGYLHRVAIDPPTVGRWHAGGSPSGTTTRMRLVLRVYMQMDGVEVSRSMAVILTNLTMRVVEEDKPAYNGQGWMIEGNV